jgi:hypothetical protein
MKLPGLFGVVSGVKGMAAGCVRAKRGRSLLAPEIMERLVSS